MQYIWYCIPITWIVARTIYKLNEHGGKLPMEDVWVAVIVGVFAVLAAVLTPILSGIWSKKGLKQDHANMKEVLSKEYANMKEVLSKEHERLSKEHERLSKDNQRMMSLITLLKDENLQEKENRKILMKQAPHIEKSLSELSIIPQKFAEYEKRINELEKENLQLKERMQSFVRDKDWDM